MAIANGTPESITLQYESGRIVLALCANDLGLLKTLEDRLHLKITTRDGWIRLEGQATDVDKARHVFHQLDAARTAGMKIRRHEFQHAMWAALEPGVVTLDRLAETRIVCSPRRPPIIPRTEGQMLYLEAIEKHDMVFGVGPAGTGKTYLAMAKAVAALKQEKVQRIILTRPAVEAGEALGFLPGDLKEKIMPYLRPLYDAIYEMMDAEEMERLIEKGIVEVAPLAYMRGRTLNHAFIVLDEAQNTTTEQMFMFLTRMGAESKCVITGDPTQVDLPGNKRSGLVEALEALRKVPSIGFCHFEDRDVIRHELVQSIVRAYRQHRDSKL